MYPYPKGQTIQQDNTAGAWLYLFKCGCSLQGAPVAECRHCAEQFEPKSGVTFLLLLRAQSVRGAAAAAAAATHRAGCSEQRKQQSPPTTASEMNNNNNLAGDEVG